MTKEDLVNTLEQLPEVAQNSQFGVGFYSAYLVSERVMVRSKHNDEEQHVWESTARGTFSVRSDSDNPYQIKRGTDIYLYLKDDCANFCKKKTINLLTIKEEEKVCIFICFDIRTYVWGGKCYWFFFEDKKKKDEVNEEDDNDKDKDKNKEKPEEVSKEEYAAFYKSISNNWEEYLAVKHFNYYLCQRRHLLICLNQRRKRITLSSSFEEFSLWMIAKIFDLNIFHIKNNPEEHREKMFADFKTFYEQFHKNIKLGIHEDSKNRNKLADLLRYYSTKSCEELTSMKEYVGIMKENQKHIYYITGESRANVEASLFLEALKKIDLEVLFLAILLTNTQSNN
ncbi:hypothetical protein RFI_26782 [Reticulomyxa filosa]|uniref:Heat shock protein 90 n=1 Tax=Reticulomyxa filosa TaxID=46433 RepID=X6MC16_RETFI|nr:hypothetical protein RFI_26782 [Reticulomyxa filosa]|eukprot:ETO10595.1 hypothetical protein RFI_26782 [Reticulomyxa filosa]